MEGGVKRGEAAQQSGEFAAAGVRAASCNAAVTYGSLRAATRTTQGRRSHEFGRIWCRMIPCAELGCRSRAHGSLSAVLAVCPFGTRMEADAGEETG